MPKFSRKNFSHTPAIIALLLFLVGCGENSGTTPALQSKNPQELIQSASEKQRIGAYDEAIEMLNRALELDPKLVDAYYRIGLVHVEADQRNEAIAAFKKALTMEPENLQARMRLAEVYSKMTRNDWAVAEFLKAEALKPNDTELLFKIALEYWYHQKINEAAEYYKKILAIDPNHMQTHLNLISVYEKLKNWEKALEEIEISKRLGRETKNDQAIAIAEGKLAFIKGRMDLTDKEYKRKTLPPFE